MDKDFPYLKMLDIARECRSYIINDTISNNSPDLYDALYSDINDEIFETKLELYELKWIENHWNIINEFIDERNCSTKEKKELMSMFSDWYNDFISNWNYSDFDKFIFEEKISILKSLLLMNNEWEENIKRMRVSFNHSKKILDEKIKKFEMEK